MHCLWPRQRENISAKTSMVLKPRKFIPANLSPSTVVFSLDLRNGNHVFTSVHKVKLYFYPNAWADQRIRQEFKSVIHPVVRVDN